MIMMIVIIIIIIIIILIIIFVKNCIIVAHSFRINAIIT